MAVMVIMGMVIMGMVTRMCVVMISIHIDIAPQILERFCAEQASD